MVSRVAAFSVDCALFVQPIDLALWQSGRARVALVTGLQTTPQFASRALLPTLLPSSPSHEVLGIYRLRAVASRAHEKFAKLSPELK